MPKKQGQKDEWMDEELDAAADEELGIGPTDVHDPLSPHGIPQIQDEEAEKADTVEEGADTHPVPPVEEDLRTDLESTRDGV